MACVPGHQTVTCDCDFDHHTHSEGPICFSRCVDGAHDVPHHCYCAFVTESALPSLLLCIRCRICFVGRAFVPTQWLCALLLLSDHMPHFECCGWVHLYRFYCAFFAESALSCGHLHQLDIVHSLALHNLSSTPLGRCCVLLWHAATVHVPP